MPRRVRYHPSMVPVQGGEPGDGDSWNEPAEQDDDDEGAGGAVRTESADRLAAIEAELARVKEENSLIKRAIPPVEPTRQVSDEVAEMSDEEFDALLFSNPREALRINNEKVKADLRREYTTNQGTGKFWEQFYNANEDLKDDDDLVQSTLQKNMAELGNMPVDKAQKRLAELTRDRILGFMKKRKEPRAHNRAVVEGSNPPSIPQAEEEDRDSGQATTMSQILRGRRAIRRKAQAA